jgi:membrane protease YdiL (CAAX protease family)
MTKFREFMIALVRPIAVALAFTLLGFSLRFLLGVFLDVKISKLLASVLNFALAAFGAFFVFPRRLKQPFGEVTLSEYARRLGFYLPRNGWKHVLLGVALALCTLLGMLTSSLLTGRYVPDGSTITLSHVVFSLNPGVWEEFFFRGIMMMVLLRSTRSVRRAALIQTLLFGLAHIKGTDLWSWVDVISVMVIALSFVYAAYKTRTLVAGIVFHFLHDALLFFVQVPEGEHIGLAENVLFYVALWIGVGVACLLTNVAAERFSVQAETEFYQVEQELGDESDLGHRHVAKHQDEPQ